MQYAILGQTGIRVSRFCLGTMEFHLLKDEPLAHRIMDRSRELGINFVDTADNYGEGASEELVGRWLAAGNKRQQVVLATKVRNRMGPGPNEVGLSRVHLMQAIEASLRRLRTDYVDLYMLHAPDDATSLEVTLRAMDDLVHEGKVRSVGCSNYASWHICKALWISDKCSLSPIEYTQPPYNLLNRAVEAELFPLCKEEKLGVVVYNPTAAGLLTGIYQWGEPPIGSRFERQKAYRNRYWYEANFRIVERLKAIAGQAGQSLAQYALAWVLANPIVTSVLTGVETVAQLEENLAALKHPLTPEEYTAGCEASGGAICGQSYFR